jgi:hypothetical protein
MAIKSIANFKARDKLGVGGWSDLPVRFRAIMLSICWGELGGTNGSLAVRLALQVSYSMPA